MGFFSRKDDAVPVKENFRVGINATIINNKTFEKDVLPYYYDFDFEIDAENFKKSIVSQTANNTIVVDVKNNMFYLSIPKGCSLMVLDVSIV